MTSLRLISGSGISLDDTRLNCTSVIAWSFTNARRVARRECYAVWRCSSCSTPRQCSCRPRTTGSPMRSRIGVPRRCDPVTPRANSAATRSAICLLAGKIGAMGCEHEDGPKCGNSGAGNRADILLDALRSSTLDFPNALSFSVIYEFSMDEMTDPDEEVSVLTDVREPSGRYRDGLLITKDSHATSLLLAGSNGTIGHGRIFTEGGKVSNVDFMRYQPGPSAAPTTAAAPAATVAQSQSWRQLPCRRGHSAAVARALIAISGRVPAETTRRDLPPMARCSG